MIKRARGLARDVFRGDGEDVMDGLAVVGHQRRLDVPVVLAVSPWHATAMIPKGGAADGHVQGVFFTPCIETKITIAQHGAFVDMGEGI